MEIQVSYSRERKPLPSEDCPHEHKDLDNESSLWRKRQALRPNIQRVAAGSRSIQDWRSLTHQRDEGIDSFGRGQSLESVDSVSVGADQNARLVPQDSFQDRPCRLR